MPQLNQVDEGTVGTRGLSGGVRAAAGRRGRRGRLLLPLFDRRGAGHEGVAEGSAGGGKAGEA